jgi:hypothetical protein
MLAKLVPSGPISPSALWPVPPYRDAPPLPVGPEPAAAPAASPYDDDVDDDADALPRREWCPPACGAAPPPALEPVLPVGPPVAPWLLGLRGGARADDGRFGGACFCQDALCDELAAALAAALAYVADDADGGADAERLRSYSFRAVASDSVSYAC